MAPARKRPTTKRGTTARATTTRAKSVRARPRSAATRTATATRTRAAKVEAAATQLGARTVVFIHGVGNKPTEAVLRCQWDRALFGFGLGERSRMAYWRQPERHGPPTSAVCGQPDTTGGRTATREAFAARGTHRAETVEETIARLATNESEAAVLREIASSMRAGEAGDARARRGKGAQSMAAKGILDPLTSLFTRLFVEDAYDFFFNAERRTRMCNALRARLESGGGPFVLVAHSQGTMIAWLVLHQMAAAGLQLPLLLTLGSPLGMPAVRDRLRALAKLGGGGRLPIPASVGTWINVRDPLDPVAVAGGLRSHFGAGAEITDMLVTNLDGVLDAHSATGYLAVPAVRQAVRARVDLQRFQPVSRVGMAADAVRDFEDRAPDERRPLLIELTDPAWAREQMTGNAAAADTPATMPAMADALETMVRQIVGKAVAADDLDFRRLRRYVSVRLTRSEAEELATRTAARADLGVTVPPLYRIWRNARKYAQLETSIHTVQASAAHRSYEALGRDIHWAVLDSGCTPHPHFTASRTIAARYNCTLQTDEPVQDGTRVRGEVSDTVDRFGHGTHVAGIIAGAYTLPGQPHAISGIAPEAKLHIYKVLNDDGEGDDGWIIKALDHIASQNEAAGRPLIAGVNLSLGGPFDQETFGCGHTPICDELRRLWRQGVVVVIAAGNEGLATLSSSADEIDINMFFSLGDPANLDDAIVVGSVHKERPHTYGVSYFSSRGPTADGRVKPDCVAPGEQILSCRHDPVPDGTTRRDLYMKLDGTSMAAPHVSGLIACFLSRRREFIGYPDKVKEILLRNCTDLGRGKSLQGAGLPNLVKMLVTS